MKETILTLAILTVVLVENGDCGIIKDKLKKVLCGSSSFEWLQKKKCDDQSSSISPSGVEGAAGELTGGISSATSGGMEQDSSSGIGGYQANVDQPSLSGYTGQGLANGKKFGQDLSPTGGAALPNAISNGIEQAQGYENRFTRGSSYQNLNNFQMSGTVSNYQSISNVNKFDFKSESDIDWGTSGYPSAGATSS